MLMLLCRAFNDQFSASKFGDPTRSYFSTTLQKTIGLTVDRPGFSLAQIQFMCVVEWVLA